MKKYYKNPDLCRSEQRRGSGLFLFCTVLRNSAFSGKTIGVRSFRVSGTEGKGRASAFRRTGSGSGDGENLNRRFYRFFRYWLGEIPNCSLNTREKLKRLSYPVLKAIFCTIMLWTACRDARWAICLSKSSWARTESVIPFLKVSLIYFKRAARMFSFAGFLSVRAQRRFSGNAITNSAMPVSYTHLTLPTIYSV